MIRDLVERSVSLLALGALSPIVAAASIAVKIESPGPVIYKQTRLGLNGKPFTIYKIRTMTITGDDSVKFADKEKARITRIGKFLRATRIDEIPQFYNVLRGDMALLGPRPERPEVAEELRKVIPHFDERSAVKPGITGLAQVQMKYACNISQHRKKIRYDRWFVKNRKFGVYLLIAKKTIQVVARREGI